MSKSGGPANKPKARSAQESSSPRESPCRVERLWSESYVPHEIDIEGRNVVTLAATATEPWERVWDRTHAARAWMLEAWFALRGPEAAANQWVRKAGAEHYGEHLERLRDWVAELIDLRTRPVVDEWEG
jgi:hypothetical protein